MSAGLARVSTFAGERGAGYALRMSGPLNVVDLFVAEWRRVGMPGEPRREPDGTASVAVASWGVRVFYLPDSAVAVLRNFPAAERARADDEAEIVEALAEPALAGSDARDPAFGCAVERSERLDAGCA